MVFTRCLHTALAIVLSVWNSSEALSEKYALVIGGASKGLESKHQEFARITIATSLGLSNKGYRVTMLFGSGLDDSELRKYSADYSKIASLHKTDSLVKIDPATTQNIDKTLNAFVAKAKPKDQIELVISAHGSDTCGELGTQIRNDIGSKCKHTFGIFDTHGKATQYSSDRILQFLKQLEDKGAASNIVFNSCHSGRAKAEFKSLGLKNTCAYFQTAGNETGFECFEDDPDSSIDYTSTGEYIALRYYRDILPRMESDPYFSQNACFQKTINHYKEKQIDLSSLATAYWSSRDFDETFQSAALSSQLGYLYFTTGSFQPQITNQEVLLTSQLKLINASLINETVSATNQLPDVFMSRYLRALDEYNQSVRALQRELNGNPSNTAERLSVATSLQKTVQNRAKTFMQQERFFIRQLFRNKDNKVDPCARAL